MHRDRSNPATSVPQDPLGKLLSDLSLASDGVVRSFKMARYARALYKATPFRPLFAAVQANDASPYGGLPGWLDRIAESEFPDRGNYAIIPRPGTRFLSAMTRDLRDATNSPWTLDLGSSSSSHHKVIEVLKFIADECLLKADIPPDPSSRFALSSAQSPASEALRAEAIEAVLTWSRERFESLLEKNPEDKSLGSFVEEARTALSRYLGNPCPESRSSIGLAYTAFPETVFSPQGAKLTRRMCREFMTAIEEASKR